MRTISLIFLIISFCVPTFANADITSTFDTDTEGWQALGADLIHVSDESNPGGFLGVQDNSPELSLIGSSKLYSGDLSMYNDGTISFDLKFVTEPYVNDQRYGTVGIVGVTGHATADLVIGTPQDDYWYTYSTMLTSDQWDVTGNWDEILSNVEMIVTTLDEGTPANASGFDNFLIKATVVPEPVSFILFLTGGAALAFRRYTKQKPSKI